MSELVNMNTIPLSSEIASPTPEEMLEMLNVDILPFFDAYDENTFTFAEKYRATSIIIATETSFIVSLNTGKDVEVSKDYFQFPGSHKEVTLFKLQNELI